MPSPISLSTVTEIASALSTLDIDVVFTGGAIIPLLIDHPQLIDARPTLDVDAIVDVLTIFDFNQLNEKLHTLGFQNDKSEDAPRCRWIIKRTKVDLMPAGIIPGELSNPWFEHALETANLHEINENRIKVVSAPSFIATKIEAFHSRGKNDFMGSHDFEDLISIIDGRARLVNELIAESSELRSFVAGAIASFVENPACMQTISGHLPPDPASQSRTKQLVETMRIIAKL